MLLSFVAAHSFQSDDEFSCRLRLVVVDSPTILIASVIGGKGGSGLILERYSSFFSEHDSQVTR